MSQPIVRFWAPATSNTATISSLQNYTAAGNLILNPTQYNSPVSKNGPYVYQDALRTVSFTSVNNLSGRNITITGIGSPVDGAGNPTDYLGNVVSETIAGPNNDTVYSDNIYKQIDSITINGAANGLSAGFGTTGITSYIFPDYDRTGWYTTFQGAIYNRTTLTYNIYVSATKPEEVGTDGTLKPYPEPLPAFLIGTANATANQFLITRSPVVIAWATIAAADDESFYFTVLQQGTRS